MLRIVFVILSLFSLSYAEWVNSLKEGLERAKQKESLLLVFIHRQGCPACAFMERMMKTDAEVKKRLERVTIAYVDLYSPDGQELSKKYGVLGTPYFVFYDPLKEKDVSTFYGSMPKPLFFEVLDKACSSSNLRC